MELKFTGERVVPGMAITYGVIEHLHRSAVPREFCRGRTVLDIGSGEGYGTSFLAAIAAFVCSLAGKLTMVVAALRLSAVAGSDKLVDLGNEITPVATLQTECR